MWGKMPIFIKIPNMRFHLFILMMCLPLLSYCQETTSIPNAADSGKIHRLILKTDMANMVNMSEALLPVSLEYRHHNIGVDFEVGIPLYSNAIIYKDHFKTTNDTKELHSDIRYKIGVRRYRKSKSPNILYYGFEISLRTQEYVLRNSGYFTERNFISFSSADIRKATYTSNVFVGTQAKITKHFFIEVQGGVGYKRVVVNRENEVIFQAASAVDKVILPIGEREDNIEKSAGVPNLVFAVRLCYWLF